NRVDDLPLGSTSSFDDDADTGYRISASLKLAERWYFNGAIMASEMSSSDSFSDPTAQLEVIRQSVTENFDSADYVQTSYDSDLSGVDLNAVYRFSDSLDFMVGIGQLSLEEKFKIVSNDTSSVLAPGEGRYVMNTDNDMLGPHFGAAWNPMISGKLGFYVVGKFGWYENDTEQRQRLDDDPANNVLFSRSNSGSDSGTSTITDIRLGLNYDFTQQFAATVGYQIIKISDVALAEDQFDTTQAGSNDVDDDGEIDWDGFNLGLKVSF
ncbi:MAG: BBP7 family outer membrane beta-barrel protein, partial [Gammaproteobacteria bacterium]|nr:BBP7 family outer membrane beta-barrel protein [Gammaproteobacteria bacterium]